MIKRLWLGPLLHELIVKWFEIVVFDLGLAAIEVLFWITRHHIVVVDEVPQVYFTHRMGQLTEFIFFANKWELEDQLFL